MIADLSGSERGSALGRINGEAFLDFSLGTARTSMRLSGYGRVKLTQGNFSRVPLLSLLGEKIGINALGKISRVETPLEFRSDRVFIPHFKTNGNVLSLEGSGTYNWRTDQLDMDVYGNILNMGGINIIPWLFKPISKFFKAELHGTLADPEWRILGGINKFIPRFWHGGKR